jgi:hypothetical protein
MLRRSKPNVALPPKETLTQADLSVSGSRFVLPAALFFNAACLNQIQGCGCCELVAVVVHTCRARRVSWPKGRLQVILLLASFCHPLQGILLTMAWAHTPDPHAAQELMEDIVEADEEPPLDFTAEPPAGSASEQRGKGPKGKAGKLGKLLYGADNPSWNYVPTCWGGGDSGWRRRRRLATDCMAAEHAAAKSTRRRRAQWMEAM